MKVEDPLKFIFFDFNTSKIKAMVCLLILSTYIGAVWSSRNSIDFNNLKYKYLKAFKYNVKTILACNTYNPELRELLIAADTENCSITI